MPLDQNEKDLRMTTSIDISDGLVLFGVDEMDMSTGGMVESIEI